MIPKFIQTAIRADSRRRPIAAKLGAKLNAIGVSFLGGARELVNAIYGPARANPADDFIVAEADLQARIGEVLTRYRADQTAYKYFYGQPYQGLGIVNVFGDRLCDYRFDDYEFRKYIKPTDRVLDVGCNCGFLAIIASYRIGCQSHGIDINPYMIEIGDHVAKHLRVSDLVTLTAGSLHDYRPEPFDVVMCFATHWTDDSNYRVSMDDHMHRMASYLKPGGTLIFETHTDDHEKPEFFQALDAIKGKLFEFDAPRKSDGGTRQLYIMKRL